MLRVGPSQRCLINDETSTNDGMALISVLLAGMLTGWNLMEGRGAQLVIAAQLECYIAELPRGTAGGTAVLILSASQDLHHYTAVLRTLVR